MRQNMESSSRAEAIGRAGEVSVNLRHIAQQTTVRVSCEAIKYFIDSHLLDPHLSPRHAAQSLSISQRYLHLIFAESGTTFCQYIRQQRLEYSRQKLLDPGAAERRICDIALELGFYDHAHFTRNFREAYGVSPKEFRRLKTHAAR